MKNGDANCKHTKPDEFGLCKKCGYSPTMTKFLPNGTIVKVNIGENTEVRK